MAHSQPPEIVLDPGYLATAFLTLDQMGLKGRRLVTLQRAGDVVHPVLYKPFVWAHSTQSLSPASAVRSRSKASRNRVLTVPSGIPSRCAISEWVKPSK